MEVDGINNLEKVKKKINLLCLFQAILIILS